MNSNKQPSQPTAKAKQKPREEWDDMEFIVYSLNLLTPMYKNALDAVKKTNLMIHEVELDKKVAKNGTVLAGIDRLLQGLHQEKAQHNQNIKNIRLDLKHYSSLYKKVKRWEDK
jgi:hypothetical protein